MREEEKKKVMNTEKEFLRSAHPIEPAMRAQIMDALRDIEAKNDVSVLFACESGSRGWGFASPDSDYDVRFIYVNRLPWYLTVQPRRDVIEVPISGDLDINGWDLRKALGLMRESNPTLLEWLRSPIVYRDERVSIYENRAALSRVRIAHEAIRVPDRSAAAERLRSIGRQSASAEELGMRAAVVLEPDEHSVGRLGDEIAHEPHRSGARADIEHTKSRDRRCVLRYVLMSEQLVTAADRQRRRAVRERGLERITVRACEIGTDDVLTLVLPTAEEPEVGPVRVEALTCGESAHLDGDVAPARALREGEDVPAVAVDAHEVRIEVRDPKIHRAQSSQKGAT